MNKEIIVIKIGGNDLATADYIPQLAAAVANTQKSRRCIIVHGGGKAISDLMTKMDVQPTFVDGQRVTDEITLEIAEMVLSGQINKSIVLALLQAGVDTLGLSGIDRALLQVEPWSSGMDRVGRIVNVRVDILQELCAKNVVPVISPISIGPAGKYNVNADHAAGAIAGAVQASEVIFISNVPGVTIDQQLIPELSINDISQYIKEGKIFGGMIPKVDAAQAALDLGVRAATITNLPGLHNGLGTTVFTKNGAHI